MKRLSLFVAITLACTLLAGPGQQALLSVKTPAAGGAWTDIEASGTTNANDSTEPTVMVWDAITLPTGTATQIRAYVRSFTNTNGLRLGLYNGAGTLLDSGTVSVTGTGYFSVTISTAVTAGTYYVAKIPQGNNDFGIGYNNASGSADYKTGETSYTLPGTLPSSEGSFTGAYAFGVYVN